MVSGTARLCALPLVAALCCAGGAMAIEEPSFEIVERHESYEVRRYAPYLVAETTVEGDFESAGGSAFRRLFAYISGANQAAEDISMTAPVTSAPSTRDGEKIEMTAPVVSTTPGSSSEAPASFTYQFVMPAGSTLDTLPIPKDERIRIREVTGHLAAVHRFSGFWTEARYRKAERTLLDALERDGVELAGEPVFARYNSPFMPWFWRRNEVMVRVER